MPLEKDRTLTCGTSMWNKEAIYYPLFEVIAEKINLERGEAVQAFRNTQPLGPGIFQGGSLNQFHWGLVVVLMLNSGYCKESEDSVGLFFCLLWECMWREVGPGGVQLD